MRAPCRALLALSSSPRGPLHYPHLRTNQPADPGPRGLSQLQGSLVPRCSHQHLTWPHCVPTPWGSLSTFSIQTPQPIQAEKGERRGLPITLLTGHMPTPPSQPSQTPGRGKRGPRAISGPLPTQTWTAGQGHTGLGRRAVSFSRRQHILDLAHAAASDMIGSFRRAVRSYILKAFKMCMHEHSSSTLIHLREMDPKDIFGQVSKDIGARCSLPRCVK